MRYIETFRPNCFNCVEAAAKRYFGKSVKASVPMFGPGLPVQFGNESMAISKPGELAPTARWGAARRPGLDLTRPMQPEVADWARSVIAVIPGNLLSRAELLSVFLLPGLVCSDCYLAIDAQSFWNICICFENLLRCEIVCSVSGEFAFLEFSAFRSFFLKSWTLRFWNFRLSETSYSNNYYGDCYNCYNNDNNSNYYHH